MRLALQHKVPDMTKEMIRFLDFRSEDLYPMTLLTVSIQEQLLTSSVDKKRKYVPSLLWNNKYCS